MTQGTPVEAVVFDVFGTIVDWREGVAREAAPFLQRHAPHIDAYEFADAWRSEYAPAMEQVRSGRRPYVSLDVLHKENLARILERFRVTGVPDLERAQLNMSWHRLDAWPDSARGISRMKRRYIVAPLSNGNIRLMVDLARRAGLPWDVILGAEIARAYKPSPEVYLNAAQALGLEPRQICMVAAHNDDLAAARHCGLQTAFVRRPKEHGHRQTTDLAANCAWEFVAENLDELATDFGCPP